MVESGIDYSSMLTLSGTECALHSSDSTVSLRRPPACYGLQLLDLSLRIRSLFLCPPFPSFLPGE